MVNPAAAPNDTHAPAAADGIVQHRSQHCKDVHLHRCYNMAVQDIRERKAELELTASMDILPLAATSSLADSSSSRPYREGHKSRMKINNKDRNDMILVMVTQVGL